MFNSYQWTHPPTFFISFHRFVLGEGNLATWNETLEMYLCMTCWQWNPTYIVLLGRNLPPSFVCVYLTYENVLGTPLQTRPKKLNWTWALSSRMKTALCRFPSLKISWLINSIFKQIKSLSLQTSNKIQSPPNQACSLPWIIKAITVKISPCLCLLKEGNIPKRQNRVAGSHKSAFSSIQRRAGLAYALPEFKSS